MRLFEAILAAHDRLASGREQEVSLPLAEFASSLPIAALTCIDPRLNHLLPDALGIPEKDFIWLRNAGNIITGPLSSTMRSLALGCAVKGAKEIAIIGHTDCLVGKTTAMALIEKLGALGIDRHKLPENLVEYFGLFGTERQNVIRGVDFVRSSPIIGAKIPVHGLLIDIQSGKLEWIVNGYQSFATAAAAQGKATEFFQKADDTLDRFTKIGQVVAQELKLPGDKIGEFGGNAHQLLNKVAKIAATVETTLGAPPALSVGDKLRQTAEKLRSAKPPHR
jgi:carbonic anhydrase